MGSQSEVYYDSLEDSEDDIIPFYEKSISKSHIELSSKNSKCSTHTLNSDKSIKEKDPYIIKEKSESRSYFDLFCRQRSFKPSQCKEIHTSSRTTEMTPRTYRTCRDFEVDSVYFKSDDNSDSSYSSTNQELSLSLTGLETVREMNVQVNKHTHNFFVTGTKLPEMGKLGPEIQLNRLEVLKRRQQYGQRVNQANKIKMIERHCKILTNK